MSPMLKSIKYITLKTHCGYVIYSNFHIYSDICFHGYLGGLQTSVSQELVEGFGWGSLENLPAFGHKWPKPDSNNLLNLNSISIPCQHLVFGFWTQVPVIKTQLKESRTSSEKSISETLQKVNSYWQIGLFSANLSKISYFQYLVNILTLPYIVGMWWLCRLFPNSSWPHAACTHKPQISQPFRVTYQSKACRLLPHLPRVTW